MVVRQFLNKHKILVVLALALVALPLATTVMASPANPNPYFDVQPDGTEVELQLRGDEHFNWSVDARGFTVVRNGGWYEYARLNPQGKLVGSGLRVGHADPVAAGLQKGLLPSAAVMAQGAKVANNVTAQGVPPLGTVKNLVVLIRFNNHQSRTLPSVADIDILFNSPGGDATLAPTGSIRDVYLENSYGQMTLNSDVSSWIDVSNSEQYYANGQSGDSTLWEALREALDALDATVDFNDYDTDNDGFIDAIAFIHSGYAAEWGGTDSDGTAYQNRIWSHRWAIQQPPWTSNEGVQVFDYHISPALWGTSGADIGRIGVIAHETGHFFGLPDLYDTDGGGDGIGSYGLMANSWDFSGTQYCPPHFSPWSKEELGWVNATVISASGQYSVAEAEFNNEFYKITQGFPSGEYLMVENRQNSGFDCSMPQGGLAIWHIDNDAGFNTEGYPGQRGRKFPENGKHYRVALLQADGNYDLERGNNRGDGGDVHHAAGVDAIGPGPGGHPNTDTYQGGNVSSSGNTISNISASGSSMTFCLNGCGGGNVSPTAVITSIVCNNNDRSCVFDGTGSSDSDGTIASYDWDFGDGNFGSGATANHTYAAYGTYPVGLTVTDNDSATDFVDDSITLTEPVAGTTMEVSSIIVDTLNTGGGNKSPRATVTIQDDQGNPVGGVIVDGTFTGDGAGTGSDTSNGAGSAVLVSSGSKKGRVNFTFCVTNVSGGSLTWTDSPNTVCASN